MPARIKALGEDLENEIPPAERQKILVAEQKKAEEQLENLRGRKILALDRKNSAKFTEVSGQMFTRLAHEAFHAYRTYVYPRQEYDVPRWLNEGLAQVFEAGLPLEADTLRIDTPDLPALGKTSGRPRPERPVATCRFTQRRQRGVLIRTRQRRPAGLRSIITRGAWRTIWHSSKVSLGRAVQRVPEPR